MASPTLSSIEFIAQEGGSPVPVDLFSEQSHHLGIFAKYVNFATGSLKKFAQANAGKYFRAFSFLEFSAFSR